eukprot:5276311-Prymnesium_polylepis.1
MIEIGNGCRVGEGQETSWLGHKGVDERNRPVVGDGAVPHAEEFRPIVPKCAHEQPPGSLELRRCLLPRLLDLLFLLSCPEDGACLHALTCAPAPLE